jgi:hypothetical protein
LAVAISNSSTSPRAFSSPKDVTNHEPRGLTNFDTSVPSVAGLNACLESLIHWLESVYGLAIEHASEEGDEESAELLPLDEARATATVGVKPIASPPGG